MNAELSKLSAVLIVFLIGCAAQPQMTPEQRDAVPNFKRCIESSPQGINASCAMDFHGVINSLPDSDYRKEPLKNYAARMYVLFTNMELGISNKKRFEIESQRINNQLTSEMQLASQRNAEQIRQIKETEKGFFERWGDNIRESRRQDELKAQEAQRQEAIKRQQAAIEHQNNIQNQCRGYGFQAETTSMANCVMQIDLAHKQLEQQKQQAEAAYNQKVQQCRSMWGQGMGQPTMSGSFGESLGNANTAYQNCMAGVPTAPTQVICNRSPNPQVNYVYCTTR